MLKEVGEYYACTISIRSNKNRYVVNKILLFINDINIVFNTYLRTCSIFNHEERTICIIYIYVTSKYINTRTHPIVLLCIHPVPI